MPAAGTAGGGARPKAAEWAVAVLFGASTLVLLAPWPVPSVHLRDACTLRAAGLGAECDVEEAIGRTGARWLRGRLRVFEDGLLLVESGDPGAPRDESRGAYHSDGALLTFSPLLRGDPLSNGRDYVARPFRWDPLGLAPHRSTAAVLVLLMAIGACVARRGRSLVQAGTIAVTVSLGALGVVPASARHAPVHVDAGDTLGAAEAIARGAVPYRSLYYSPYTPLGAYLFSWWDRLWPGTAPAPYDWSVGLVVMAEIACAAIVLVLLLRAGVERGLALASALSLLAMTLWFDGLRVLHEPLFLVLVLGAAWLAWPADLGASRAAAAGALTAAAFLVKQYGGFGLVGLLVYAAVMGGARWRRMAWTVAGFGLGLGLGGALLALRGVAPLAFLRALVPSAPVRYELTWMRLFLWECPIVLPALAVPLLPGAWSRPIVRLAVCFGLASALPLLLRQHQYYFLDLCPWLFLLFAAGLEHVPRVARAWVVAAAFVLLATMPVRAAVTAATVIEADWRADQRRRAFLMTRLWPPERPTLVLVHPGLQHLTHYRSPDEPVVGYRYIVDVSADRLEAGFRGAAGAWIDARGMFARRPDATLRSAGTSLRQELERNGFQPQLLLEDRFELWTRDAIPRRDARGVAGVSFEGLGEDLP